MATRLAIPFLLCLFFLAVALTGCVSDSDREEPALPWNEPAGWEHDGFNIPI